MATLYEDISTPLGTPAVVSPPTGTPTWQNWQQLLGIQPTPGVGTAGALATGAELVGIAGGVMNIGKEIYLGVKSLFDEPGFPGAHLTLNPDGSPAVGSVTTGSTVVTSGPGGGSTYWGDKKMIAGIIGGQVLARHRGFVQIMTASGKVVWIKTAKQRRPRAGRSAGGILGKGFMAQLLQLKMMEKVLK